MHQSSQKQKVRRNSRLQICCEIPRLIAVTVIVLLVCDFALGNLYAELLGPFSPNSLTNAKIPADGQSPPRAVAIAPLITDLQILKPTLCWHSPTGLYRARVGYALKSHNWRQSAPRRPARRPDQPATASA
jgi:hypothetical protein